MTIIQTLLAPENRTLLLLGLLFLIFQLWLIAKLGDVIGQQKKIASKVNYHGRVISNTRGGYGAGLSPDLPTTSRIKSNRQEWLVFLESAEQDLETSALEDAQKAYLSRIINRLQLLAADNREKVQTDFLILLCSSGIAPLQALTHILKSEKVQDVIAHLGYQFTPSNLLSRNMIEKSSEAVFGQADGGFALVDRKLYATHRRIEHWKDQLSTLKTAALGI